LGEKILAALKQTLFNTCPNLLSDVRGTGLLIGIEFHTASLAGDFMLELLQRRVIVSHSLNAHRVMRLTPPAVLTEVECDWLLGAIEEAACELKQRYSHYSA
jgi:putrescine aminotransferase